MIKLFFITFFMAEMIIATAIILKIYKLNKRVNCLNNFILSSQNDLKEIFCDVRFLLQTFNKGVIQIKEAIKQKKEEYLLTLAKRLIIFLSFLSLSGKYKKILLAYEIGREIYQEFQEE